MVDSEKRGHVTMNSSTGYRRGFLLCQQRKAKPLIDITRKRRKKPFVCEWKKVGRQSDHHMGPKSQKRPFAGRKPSVLFRNALNREFSATAPMQKLVTDIMYVRIGHDFAYLSVVMDLFNNEIVAWQPYSCLHHFRLHILDFWSLNNNV